MNSGIIDINLEPGSTIVVAMSGGVDSSVVAGLLKDMGYNVIGVTLSLYEAKDVKNPRACCASSDIFDARKVARDLGIKHYVLDYASVFKEEVIDDFVDSYLSGYTPLPCTKCNQTVKFRDLLKFAKDLDAKALATGHYVQKKIGINKLPTMHMGANPIKDQSYFLFSTTIEQLDYLIFPLGGYHKDDTRKLAKKYGLDVADKPDSQNICFVPNGDYREVIRQLRPNSDKKGKFLHVDGFELGEHDGIISYTIGQRRGLNVAFGSPLYVVSIDKRSNIVYLGPKSSLEVREFVVNDFNWIAKDIDMHNLKAEVKIRSTMNSAFSTIEKIDHNKVKITLDEPEFGVSPGQAAVIYDKTRLLGGGWIMKNKSNF